MIRAAGGSLEIAADIAAASPRTTASARRSAFASAVDPAPSRAHRAFANQAVKASEGVAGLSAAMRGLIAARTAEMTVVGAIDADMRRMARASVACRRLMTIPGVGQLTALAFVAAIDDPSPEHAALVSLFSPANDAMGHEPGAGR